MNTQALPTLPATVTTIFGAARALPGLTASFDLAPYLLSAAPEDIAALRAARWSQDGDGDFLMDAVSQEDGGEGGHGDVTRFMAEMTALRDASVDEVCWRVSVDQEAAEAFLRAHKPEMAKAA